MNNPIVVHITDVGNYKGCRRRWQWGSRYQSNLAPRSPYPPFFIGRGVHYIAEQLRSEGTAPLRALSAFLRHELRPYRTFYPSPEWPDIRPLISPMVTMINALVEQYIYFSRNNHGPFADENLETLAHELKVGENGEFPAVLLSIGGKILTPHVYLAGTLDGLDRVRRDGSVWISEYKTCRDIEERMKLLQHDEQATAYCFIAQQLFGDISGIIYTLMRKKIPSVPKVLQSGYLSKAHIDTTPATYRAAIYRLHGNVNEAFIQRNYGDYLNGLKMFGEPYVARVAIERSQAHIDQYIYELHQTALEMYDPHTYINATRTWSCPGCQFRQPCLAKDAGDETRMRDLLKYNYRQRDQTDPIPLQIQEAS